MKRIVYQDWIVELGCDPSHPRNRDAAVSNAYNRTIITAVNQAMENLDEDEAAFIRFYYMQGMNYRRISHETGKPIYRLETLHRRALRKLRSPLHNLLGGRYNIPSPENPDCPLCFHPRSEEIDRLIQSKTRPETWRRIIRSLREEFGIILPTLQLLIGHSKYHIKQRRPNGTN